MVKRSFREGTQIVTHTDINVNGASHTVDVAAALVLPYDQSLVGPARAPARTDVLANWCRRRLGADLLLPGGFPTGAVGGTSSWERMGG